MLTIWPIFVVFLGLTGWRHAWDSGCVFLDIGGARPPEPGGGR